MERTGEFHVGLPACSIVLKALQERSRLDKQIVQEHWDVARMSEHPDKVERALAQVPEARIDRLVLPVGLYQVKWFHTEAEVESALREAVRLGSLSRQDNPARAFATQKAFWLLAAECARSSCVLCSYVTGLSPVVAKVLVEIGFDEAAAGHMVNLMPLTLSLQSGGDAEAGQHARKAWKAAIEELHKKRVRKRTIKQLEIALTGGVVSYRPQPSPVPHTLSPKSPWVETCIWQLLDQGLSQAGVTALLYPILLDETQSSIKRVKERYADHLNIQKIQPLYISPARRRRLQELTLKLLCLRLRNGFTPQEAVALFPYAALHAVWAEGIEPSIVWIDYLARNLHEDICSLCHVTCAMRGGNLPLRKE